MEDALLGWFRENGRDLPWRRTHDPYAILVSEVMLQQTQVERVSPRFNAWLERWPTVESLAAATLADVLRFWQGLGYTERALLTTSDPALDLLGPALAANGEEARASLLALDFDQSAIGAPA